MTGGFGPPPDATATASAKSADEPFTLPPAPVATLKGGPAHLQKPLCWLATCFAIHAVDPAAGIRRRRAARVPMASIISQCRRSLPLVSSIGTIAASPAQTRARGWPRSLRLYYLPQVLTLRRVVTRRCPTAARRSGFFEAQAK